MCEDVSISHQALVALVTFSAAQPWKVYVEFKGNQEVTGHDDSNHILPCVLGPCIAFTAGTK